jgi:hypothetical protein
MVKWRSDTTIKNGAYSAEPIAQDNKKPIV